MSKSNEQAKTKPCAIHGVSARSLSKLSVDELNRELEFIDNCIPSNSTQLNFLIKYASKIKDELNVR